jgi:hypothetical protein
VPRAVDEVIQQDPFQNTGQITTAVITGEHPYDVPAFHRLFRSLPQIDYYSQHMDQFLADWGNVRTRYDVVLFFNWHLDTPPENERGWWQQGRTRLLEELGQTEQGIVVLHHAEGAFPDWPFWSEMVGIPHEDRGYTLDEVRRGLSLGENMHLEIVDPEHPITRGLSSWDVLGETWDFGPSAPNADCHVLMTTDHPKVRMKAMAWTHQFRKARVFYLQPGHNNGAWAHETFRTLLSRGIQWAARRL